jgi:hypothetical protein
MKYFKVIKGFRTDEFIPIDETELDKAIYAHLTGKVVSFNNGSINGDAINSVMPDWHRAMGWNYGHIMQTDDWDEIRSKGIENKYAGAIGESKEKVQYLIETNQLHLLGKPVEGFEPKKIDGDRGDMKSIGDVMKG